jgi:hypothetical protein
MIDLESSVSSDDAANLESLFLSVGEVGHVPRSRSLGNGETDVDAHWAEHECTSAFCRAPLA